MGTANNTVTKKEIIELISGRTGIRKTDVKRVIQEFLDEIINEMSQGKRLEFREFGVFEVRRRAARIGQNPRTLQPVPVPAKNIARFKAGRRMREAVESAPILSDEEPLVEVKAQFTDGTVEPQRG